MTDINNDLVNRVRKVWRNRIDDDRYGDPIDEAQNIKYIHVGYHRCGAAFFQKELFPKYPECNYIFSDDAICGGLFDNGYNTIDTVKMNHPDAHIILVIRNQKSIINSSYRNFIKTGGTWKFPRFAKEIMNHNKYDYFTTVSRYFELFGKDKCLVLVYEELIKDPDSYIEKVVSFISDAKIKKHDLTPVRPGPSIYYNAAIRWINILIEFIKARVKNEDKKFLISKARSSLLAIGATIDNKLIKPITGNGGKQFGYKNCADIIDRYYDKNNRKLEKSINVNLNHYGY